VNWKIDLFCLYLFLIKAQFDANKSIISIVFFPDAFRIDLKPLL